MTTTNNVNILNDLEQFYIELKSFKSLQERLLNQNTLGHWYTERDELREKLVRTTGMLKEIIIVLTGKQSFVQNGIQYDIWSEIFSQAPSTPKPSVTSILAITFGADCTNEAIGKLESDIQKGIRDKQGILIEKPAKSTEQKDTVKLPIQLFDSMQLHLKVVEVSKGCFIAGNYREAILNAFICLIDYVKERTGLDLDGDNLMNQVFSIDYDKEQRSITKYPIIRINQLQNKSDRDEQQGFMFLCKGAVGGIRNPKAHKLIPQSDPLHTLEYLAFASLLIRRIEEGKLFRTSQSRKKWDWDSFIKDTQNKCERKIINLTKNLYGFTSVNSDSISWGTGIKDGSFTFRKLSIYGEISIFSVYSCGWVYANFGSMINKTVPDSIIEAFRTSLNTIPSINIPKSTMTDGKYARIYENLLTNSNNLQIFKDTVTSLCLQLENN
ncbi:hypothetical protein ES707_16884 [subsurface metagenome]